jgi:hypothetical protein
MAVEAWVEIRSASIDSAVEDAQPRLERGLAAFDMFVLHGPLGDMDDVSHTT